jgi:pimeloyl-ACP methyl ester carboxylesterase
MCTFAAFWLAIEAVFYSTCWLPKYRRLNAQPLPRHAPLRGATTDPHRTFRRFVDGQSQLADWICIEDMLSKWFGGSVPAHDIPLGNIAELIAYGFYYQTVEAFQQEHGFPAERLAQQLAAAWGLNPPSGYNPQLGFMAHLWQPVRCCFRPAAFYLGIELLFALKHALMWGMGFQHTRVAGFDCYHLDSGAAAAPSESQRKQQGSRVPILFAHGVGLGLLPYSMFVARIAATGHPVAALECSHLGMRWTSHLPDADEVAEAMVSLLRNHLRWAPPLSAASGRRQNDQQAMRSSGEGDGGGEGEGGGGVCIAGHSYGTFFASRLMQMHPELVHSTCLIDPVAFNMFTGGCGERWVGARVPS